MSTVRISAPSLVLTASSPVPLAGETGPKYNPVRYQMNLIGKNFPNDLWTLGCGYNLFGYYASAASTTLSLFDWNRANTIQRNGKDIPDLVTRVDLYQTNDNIQSGETVAKFQEKFSAKIALSGSYLGLFSASVEAAFGHISKREISRYYTIFEILYNHCQYSFDPFSNSAQSLLNPDFLNALYNYPPDYLYNIYGTHFLSKIIVGGRLDFASSTNIDKFSDKTDIEINAKARANFLIGKASGGTNSSYNKQKTFFEKHSRSNILQIGGNDFPIINPTTLQLNLDNYSNWIDSVKRNPAFVSFGGENNLHPIHDLVDIGHPRKQELIDALSGYMAVNGNRYHFFPDVIVDVNVKYDDSFTVARATSGFELLPAHLDSMNPSPPYSHPRTYLEFVKESKNNIESTDLNPIVDLKLSETNPGVGFQKVNQIIDIGNNVNIHIPLYLWKKYGNPGQYNDAVREFKIVTGPTKNFIPPYGFIKLSPHVNRRKYQRIFRFITYKY
jgi:hypothetical protein